MNTNSFKRILEMQGHLKSALKVANANMGNERSVAEAKSHIKKAIDSLDKVQGKQVSKKQMTPLEKWQESIAKTAEQPMSKTAIQPMSKEAKQAIMKNLDKLIKEKENYIDSLKSPKESDEDGEITNLDIDLLNG